MTVTNGGSTPEFLVDSAELTADTSLIQASAGTGKTFNIAYTVIRLLLERDASGAPMVDGIGSILVVTFTNAATEELVSRIREKLGLAFRIWSGLEIERVDSEAMLLRRMAGGREGWALDRIRAALGDLDRLSVSTIHSFCVRVLDEYALESGAGYDVKLLEEPDRLIVDSMQDWWRRTFYGDQQLASWAVAGKSQLPPDFHMGDYRLWQRWPNAAIEPSPGISETRRAVSDAVAAFGRQATEDALADIGGTTEWNKGAEVDTEDGRMSILQRVERACSGDWGTALLLAEQFSEESLKKKINKRSKSGKAVSESLHDWPIVRAAETLGSAFEDLMKAVRVDCLREARRRAGELKRERNAVAFDDLLEEIHDVLFDPESGELLASLVRRQFQAALIDEFQDTDERQYSVFQKLFTGLPLFLIGDPKQAIYAFRGADVHAFLSAATASDRRFTLRGNFRSTPSMVRAVNILFSSSGDPFLEPDIGFEPVEAMRHPAAPAKLKGQHSIEWLFLPPDVKKDKVVATGIGVARDMFLSRSAAIVQELLDDGWKPESIGILVRRAEEGIEIVRQLTELGIPAVLSRTGDVMHSREADELLTIMEALASPQKAGRVRAAMTTLMWGADYGEMKKLAESEGQTQWDEAQGQFVELQLAWQSRGIVQCLERLVDMRGIVSRFLALDDGERRLANFRHLQELLLDLASEGSGGIEDTIRAFVSQRAQTALAGGVRELRLDTDDNAVQVTTIHGSKGLEYDIVLCPTLWRHRAMGSDDAVLIHDSDGVVFDHGSPEYLRRRALAERDQLAEDVRLTYVALTRAVYRTYVGWGPIGEAGKVAGTTGLSWLICNKANKSPENLLSLMSEYSEWRLMLDSMVDRSAGLMKVESIENTMPARSRTGRRESHPVKCSARAIPPSPPLRDRFSTYSVPSYSSLTRRLKRSHEMLLMGDGRDRDESSLSESSSFSIAHGVAEAEEGSSEVGVVAGPSDFRTFPGGAGVGDALHSMLETLDFRADESEIMAGVSLMLDRLQLTGDDRNDRALAACGAIKRLLREPFAGHRFSLSDIPFSATMREWQFLLSLADEHRALTSIRLSEAFRDFGGEQGIAYADQLQRLSFGTVYGFLTGFVDLLFEHDGRWYVVDWKSNQLGFVSGAYGQDSLSEAMNDHHFTLQYHLYVLAVHRYLSKRVKRYDYDTHFGGVAYAFLRGFSVGQPEGSGWYTARPNRELIENLDSIFRGVQGGACR